MEELLQDWTLYETNDEGDGPRLWQIRDSFPDGLDAMQYPVAVVIDWNYADDGLPDAETLLVLHEFEEHLSPLDSASGNSLLVHIIRGSGASELCYYVRDYNLFIAEFNLALSGQASYPIEIEFMNDPSWNYRRSIIENFSQ